MGSGLIRFAVGALVVAVLVAVGGAVFAMAAMGEASGVRWGTGAILVVLLAATWLLCAHAGGHAWFVPMPALLLAAGWALTISARSPAAGWWLVALSATASAAAVMVVSGALRQRLVGASLASPPKPGADGVAVTDLVPAGIVRVAGENWSARSLSGRLAAGAPVHVVKLSGVRLEVWSEAGSVTDASALSDVQLSDEEDRW